MCWKPLLKAASDMYFEPKYPDVVLNVGTVNSSASGVIGAVGSALRKAGVASCEIETFSAEAMSGDYNHLLRTAMRWVKFTD